MHKISHMVESYRTCLFEYLIGGQLLGVTANQSQLFSPCKVILLISFINSFLFFALPYPFKDTQRCKSNNTTKEGSILWHTFFFLGGQVLHSNTHKEEISTHFLDTCWDWQSCRFPLSSLIMRYFKLHSWRWHIFDFLYHQSPNIPSWVLLLRNYNVAQYLFVNE